MKALIGAALVALAVAAAAGLGCNHNSVWYSHGPAWQRACAKDPSEGCACKSDDQCDSNWCVNEVCTRREP
jgi:hypothetical protein